MSYFRAILFVILSFWSSSSLMGMESLFSRFKKANQTNQNYNSEELKGLLLFKNAEITDEDGISVPKDVKDLIAQNGYLLILNSKPSHYNALDLDDITNLRYGLDNSKGNSKNIVFDYNLTRLNDKDRIQRYKGIKIASTDFDLMTINNESKETFERLMIAIPHKNKDGVFAHPYPLNFVTGITYLEHCKEDIQKLKKIDKQLRKHDDGFFIHSLLLPHEYNNILRLPLNLRRKVGDLVTVKVVGEEEISFDIKRKNICIGATAGFMPCFLAGVSELKNMNSLEKISELCCITAIFTTIGAMVGAINPGRGIDPDDRVYKVEEKPLITLEEKSAIENKAYNDELKFLQQHLQAMDNSWVYQSEREIFNQNRNAIEQEIESLKKHRMIFTHSNMKNNDFENVQMERNTAKTKEIWNNLPLHKKILIYGGCSSSPINPDVEMFNNLQNKYYAGLAKKKSAIRE